MHGLTLSHLQHTASTSHTTPLGAVQRVLADLDNSREQEQLPTSSAPRAEGQCWNYTKQSLKHTCSDPSHRASNPNSSLDKCVSFVYVSAFLCQGHFGCRLVSSLIPGASFFFVALWYFGTPTFAVDEFETYHFFSLAVDEFETYHFFSFVVDESETYHFFPLRSMSPELITFSLPLHDPSRSCLLTP